ncbi:unnamed protein product [Caenorhabditis bovis]|uniref:G protein-coupled receptor n=1 Tax=Caenorhabditis bovis TaxID=2654633 RepID=A0A8S1EYP0_9PELO|nr:unnamed protein product [Caenorhabditis bovis]
MCLADDELPFKSITFVCYIVFFPFYLAAFYALIYKCPTYFKHYRVLLLLHVSGNFVFDTFMSFFWHPQFILPWVAICTTGITYDFPYAMFYIFYANLIYTGLVILYMFEYRMTSVVTNMLKSLKRFFQSCQRFIEFECVLICVNLMYCREHMIRFEHKIDIHLRRGPMPYFVFCDRCIFYLDFDFIPCITLLILSASTLSKAAVLVVVYTSVMTRKLQKSTTIMSTRTLAMQHSFLRALIIQASCHVLLIGTPVSVFLLAHIFDFTSSIWHYLTFILTLMLAQHGGVCAVVLLACSKPLRDAITEIGANSICVRALVRFEMCDADDDSVFKTITFSCFALFLPFYLAAFYALIYKCPTYFKHYRILLLLHVSGNFFFDTFMSFFWHPQFILPWVAICSTGIAHDFPFAMFYIFYANMIYTGLNILYMFEYRMSAVISNKFESTRRFFQCCQRFIEFQCVLICVNLMYCREHMISFEHKIAIHLRRGPMPYSAFCDRCIFYIDVDFIPCITLLILSASAFSKTVVLVVVYTSVTIRELRNSTKTASVKTLTMQRAFLNALIIQASSHVVFLAFPVCLFLLAHIIDVGTDLNVLAAIFSLMAAQHGGVCAILLIACSKPLRSSITQNCW